MVVLERQLNSTACMPWPKHAASRLSWCLPRLATPRWGSWRPLGTAGDSWACPIYAQLRSRAGRVEAVRPHGFDPAGASSAPRTWSSRSQDSLNCPAASSSARHRGRDHDEDGRDDDADDPPDPVDAARRLNTERCGDVVADEHSADPAENSKPERNVVAVAWRDELAQQADDDACDDHTDDVHRRPLSPVGDGLVRRRCGSTRPAEGSIPAWQPLHN